MGEVSYDEKKAEAFSDRMVGVLNNGALALMCSLGHRTGLFDTMAEINMSTSVQIAEKAGLNERYVRDWLGTMWGRELAEKMLADGGFTSVDVLSLDHDAQNFYYVASKS